MLSTVSKMVDIIWSLGNATQTQPAAASRGSERLLESSRVGRQGDGDVGAAELWIAAAASVVAALTTCAAGARAPARLFR